MLTQLNNLQYKCFLVQKNKRCVDFFTNSRNFQLITKICIFAVILISILILMTPMLMNLRNFAVSSELYFYFNQHANKLMKLCLEHRYQSVNVNNSLSIPKEISSRLPQGFIPGLILLRLIINDLTFPYNTKIYLYASYMQIYIS